MWSLLFCFGCVRAQSPEVSLDGPSASVYFEDSYTISNEDSFEIYDPDGNRVFRISLEEDAISMERRMEVHGNLLGSASARVSVQGTEQWKLAVLEDFQGAITGWSDDSVNRCGTNPDLYLGGHCKYSAIEVSKSWTLPEHHYIQIKLNVHWFDRWEGESVFLKVDGVVVWAESYVACSNLHAALCQYKGIDACGDNFPDRLAHPVKYIGPHVSESVTLEIGSGLARDPCEVSWGFDDIEILIK